ncbi:MAG TPA: SDR family oxidoreductase [Polyangia bacterium]|jgi:3-oxoacyl-[acyl-carrier protein] reductase|nr:SDR family oxidoreductase [Polyangia bacterium]
MKLQGRKILITGASQGFGLAVAERCLAEGADVAVCARSREQTEHAAAALRAQAGQAGRDQRVAAGVADVSNPKDVEALVADATRELGGLDGLVNNAGVYGPKGLIEEVDWADWAKAIEINLLGTVLPCRAVLPGFRRRGSGKIVNLSGGGATAPLPRLSAYAASKAAVVRFTETLAEELRDTQIDVNAIAPGALNTRLLDEVIAAGPDKVGKAFYDRSLKQKADGGAPLDKGAALCAFLLSSESDGITGRLLSAVWDPWSDLPGRRAELEGSDIYTLRRIVPRDRGKDWGEP